MKTAPRPRPVEHGPTVTFTMPLADLVGPLHVTAPPPELLTQRNCGHLGLVKRDFLEVVRAMKADPDFAHEVICRGKLRGASPGAIVRFLRYGRVPSTSLHYDGDDGAALDALRKELNLEPVPASGARRRIRGGVR